MQVRLSSTDDEIFRFVPAANLHLRGTALRAAGQAGPLAAHYGASWMWGGDGYERIDFMGPLTLEFWNDDAPHPQETFGLFDRLYLVNRTLFHRKFVIASYEPNLAHWLCTSTGQFCQEVRFRGRTVAVPRRHAMIQQAAYFNAERRGFFAGQEQDDWLRAEAQIDTQLWYCSGRTRLGPPLLKV